MVGYIRKIVREFYKKNNLPDKAKKVKVGHAGTLDPFATGLLIVAIGREATKRIDEFKNLKKEYVTTLQLGATSDTLDRTGEIKQWNNGTMEKLQTKLKELDKKKLTKVLKEFIGKQTQIPPMYSAKKVGGKKLYELARKGIEIERKPCEIEIYDIKLLEFPSHPDPPQAEKDPSGSPERSFVSTQDDSQLKIKVTCSPGTYIRVLCQDIGEKLGVGAYCEELERTAIGDYHVEAAIEPKAISADNLKNYIIK